MNLHIPTPPNSDLSFNLFGTELHLHLYALCILTGCAIAIMVTLIRVKKFGLAIPAEQVLNIAMIGIPSGIVGARVYYVVTMWPNYAANPISALYIWEGGLGIIGGIVFGVGAAALYIKMKKLPLGEVLFAAIPTIPLAQAVGRLGNYFNGELYGTQTTLPWGLDISRGHYEATVFYHPTFLYELLWNLLIAAVLLSLKPGAVERMFGRTPAILPLYTASYTFGRFFVELLRTDSSEYVFGLRVNLLYIVALFLASAIVLVILRYKVNFRNKTAVLASHSQK